MKNIKNIKTQKRLRIKKKVRSKVFGTASLPRLSIFRSAKHIYAQIIDDTAGITLASASDAKIATGSKSEKAAGVGKLVAQAGKEKKIDNVVFDRNGFKYTGRVKLLADAAREAGLKF